MTVAAAEGGSGFLGLRNPSPQRPCRAAVVGASGRFFDEVLRASAHVELYDEELGYEPYRRGLRTERVSPARLGSRLESLIDRGVFPCAVGYQSFPPRFVERGAFRSIVFSPRAGPSPGGRGGTAAPTPELIVGVRAGPPFRLAEAPRILTARECITGGKPPAVRLSAKGRWLLVIDPLVMDPPLFSVPGNLEPGGLQWHAFTGLLRSSLDGGSVAAALVNPCTLPKGDLGPSFVLARLVAKVLAYALAHE